MVTRRKQTSKISKNLLDEIELLPPFLCSQGCYQWDDPIVYFDGLLGEVVFLKDDVGVGCHHQYHLEAHYLEYVHPFVDCCPRPQSLGVLAWNLRGTEPPHPSAEPPHPVSS